MKLHKFAKLFPLVTGVIVNALAGRLLNPVKKEFNPYTS